MDTGPSTLVVGAGLAGLSAGLELADRGIEVTVLEARTRVGGRVRSERLANGEVAELGAEWIMPGDGALLQLAERFGVEAVESGVDYKMREARGPNSASLAEQLAILDRADAARSRVLPEEEAELTLGDFLDLLEGTPAQLTTLRVRLQGTCATDLDRVALRVAQGERAFAAGEGPYYRIADGNQVLAEAMASALDVRLGAEAESIAHGREAVTVRAGGSALRAHAVVVALPAPIVAGLPFDPVLPEELATALRELPMGVASKLAAPIEGVPALRSIQSTELPFWCWVANGRGGQPRRCLTSFAGSELAQEGLRTSAGDPGPWLDRLRILDPELAIAGPARMKTWADDPFTFGAYSAWDNRSFDRIDQFRRRVGRIAFAGEHTAGPLDHGTMNGAILSGRRAAAQVLEILS